MEWGAIASAFSARGRPGPPEARTAGSAQRCERSGAFTCAVLL
jgi:hypothetical protein